MVQPVSYLLVDGIGDVILQFVGILLEIVKLIAVVVALYRATSCCGRSGGLLRRAGRKARARRERSRQRMALSGWRRENAVYTIHPAAMPLSPPTKSCVFELDHGA